ncbi:MAG: diguanylate cyclase, partial [Leptolyngbyaceae cyanobacterium]
TLMGMDDLNSGFSPQACSQDSDDGMSSAQACYRAHRSRVEWDHIIATIALRIRRSLTLPDILQTSVDEVRQLLECDRVLIYEFTPDWQGRVTYESISSSQWSLLDQAIHDSCFSASRLKPYQEGRAFVCADIREADLTPCHGEMLQRFQVIANLAVPILHEEQLWGLLIAHHCTVPYVWDSQQIEGLQQIAVHIGIAVHQAALVEQLQAANTMLNAQVQERTALLEWTNQDLLEEVYERRKATAAVVQQAQFWCQVFDSLFTFVGVMSPDGILLEINQAALQVADLDRKAVIGKPFVDTYWWEYDAAVQVQIGEAIAQANQGKTVRFDIPAQVNNGRHIMVDFSLTPLRDGTGAITHLIPSGSDITDRKQAELDLQTTKNQLELFIQATSEGFWDWNLVTHEIYLSPRWKAMLGYRDDELENSLETWDAVMVESDRQLTHQLIQDYNSGNIDEFKTTQRFQHKDGSVVHILIRAIHLKNEQGEVIRMVGSHLDMTATVAMQAALQTSELQLSGILNSSLDGIMAFRSVRNEQGQIVDFEWLISNPAACAMVGRPANSLIGHHLLEELPGNRDEGLFDLYVQVVESGEPIQRQFHYTHDGIDSWFENIAVKLEDGFAVTFRNITAMKQSEQALQRANRQLEDNINDLKQRNTEMRLLSETSDFLQACRSIDEACAVITSLVEPLFPECSGGIFITNPSRNRAESVAVWGDRLYSQPDFAPHECWALRRGRSHWVGGNRAGLRCDHVLLSDGQGDQQRPRQSHQSDQSQSDPAQNSQPQSDQSQRDPAQNRQTQSDRIPDTLCIPMIAQGETLGLFYLSSFTAAALPDSKQQLAQTVAEQIGLAIANLRLRETLHHQSIRDPLTGLFNRRYLEESLTQELVRAQRNQQPIGIIMIDVDHFKHFNDTFGHDAGDLVLQSIGNLLRDGVRGSDIACRYGGEEMTLVLPESSLRDTAMRAETLRQAISHLQLKHNNQRLENLTASFGVACFPQHGISGRALLQSADAALYRAKSAGRNQVVTAT